MSTTGLVGLDRQIFLIYAIISLFWFLILIKITDNNSEVIPKKITGKLVMATCRNYVNTLDRNKNYFDLAILI